MRRCEVTERAESSQVHRATDHHDHCGSRNVIRLEPPAIKPASQRIALDGRSVCLASDVTKITLRVVAGRLMSSTDNQQATSISVITRCYRLVRGGPLYN